VKHFCPGKIVSRSLSLAPHRVGREGTTHIAATTPKTFPSQRCRDAGQLYFSSDTFIIQPMKNHIAFLLLLIPLTGIRAGAAEPIPLRAGPLSMVFDVDNAMLRFIRVGKAEVLRGINAPVRNQFWGTLSTEVTNVRLDDGGDHFNLRFDVACRERDIDFIWSGNIVGTAEGHVTFTFDGEAHSTFLRNRLGFCVLHGPSAAGQPWVIEDIHGNKTPGHFPDFISPRQPAKNIRAISHEVTTGLWADVRCEGDTFEMEDQRNWTDASFKTYCTPLELPYPVEVVKGTKISHRVQVSVRGENVKALAQDDRPVKNVALTIADGPEALHPLPGIGLQVSSQVAALSNIQLGRLMKLNLDHLRVTITPAEDPVKDILIQAAAQANALGVPLHIGLQLGDKPAEELSGLAVALETIRPPVSAWFVMAANPKTFQLARQHLSGDEAEALFGVGEANHFTDLNRNRPEDRNMQVVSYGLDPQCHAHDNLTMIETLEIQGDTVRSARQFIGGRRLLISPITLKYQVVDQAPLPGELPSNVDGRRQPSLFAAGWTLGSIKYLSEAGVDGLTYYETVGWKGIMAPGRDLPLPAVFRSKPDEVFAVYHVLRDVGEFTGGQVREVRSADALSVVGLALVKEGRTRLLVANLTSRPRSLRIRGLVQGDAAIFRLDRGNITSAKRDPEAFRREAGPAISVTGHELEFSLPPFGIARLDQGG